MSNNFYSNELFPTTVVHKDFPNIVTKKIQDHSRQIARQYGTNTFYSPCLSTVESYGKVLDLPEFTEIKKAIVESVAVFTDIVKIDNTNLKFLGSWLNLYEQHGYQDLHNHHDSMISGVFYIKSTGVKDFIFQAPWHFQQSMIPEYSESTLSNSHNIEYNSVEGRVIIFMSHALHRTLPASEERISLSFNIG